LPPRMAAIMAMGIAVYGFLFFTIRVWQGYWFTVFVDESEHLLGGKMLDSGATLYGSFVSQHGPLTFMLTPLYGAVLGWTNVNGARLISTALALAAGTCIAFSPVRGTHIERLWAFAFFFGLIACVWLLQGLYLVNYHAIAGFLVVVALALFVVPL